MAKHASKITRAKSMLRARVSTNGLMSNPEAQSHSDAIRFLWRVHVQGCLRKSLTNGLTITGFAALSVLDCRWCGAAPYQRVLPPGTSPIAANGIDRLDNTIGYIAGNMVPCCKVCNAMKSGMPEAQFVAHVKRMAKHLQ